MRTKSLKNLAVILLLVSSFNLNSMTQEGEKLILGPLKENNNKKSFNNILEEYKENNKNYFILNDIFGKSFEENFNIIKKQYSLEGYKSTDERLKKRLQGLTSDFKEQIKAQKEKDKKEQLIIKMQIKEEKNQKKLIKKIEKDREDDLNKFNNILEEKGFIECNTEDKKSEDEQKPQEEQLVKKIGSNEKITDTTYSISYALIDDHLSKIAEEKKKKLPRIKFINLYIKNIEEQQLLNDQYFNELKKVNLHNFNPNILFNIAKELSIYNLINANYADNEKLMKIAKQAQSNAFFFNDEYIIKNL